jgi:uncharacterized membrane protein HdeD (DUF308 family)
MINFKQIKWNSSANSIILLLFGLLLLIFPIESLNIGGYVIASVLLLFGLGYIIRIIMNKGIDTNGDIINIVFSVAFIILSISIFIDPTWIIRMINVVVGILLIVTSIMNLLNIMKFTKDRTTSWWIYFSLIVLVFLLGILVIINPLFLAKVIVRLEGISLIIGSIITMLLTKKVEKTLLPIKKSE